jgi:sulfate adenylyltransferase subunit 1
MANQSNLIADNIEEYLKQHENKGLLRMLTCGSVDDGKSTLIGRLLYDSKMIFEDQLAAIEQDSKKVGTQGGEVDLALLVDGLQSEREQGITIDVAYRYFSTDRRKFIIADTPGHEQYTRNMATGASTADLAIILIDARHGVQTQTKRHSYIVNLLGIRHIVIAVNKMDLMDFSEERFEEIKEEYLQFAKELGIVEPIFVPISALNGDNVVNASEQTPWYKGMALMELFDTIDISEKHEDDVFRFPVQWVNRPHLNFRGFTGTLASGSIKVGDEVTALPSLKSSTIKQIIPPAVFPAENSQTGEEILETIDEAFAPMAVTLTMEDEIDISRGDMIVHSSSIPEVSANLEVMVVWMDEASLLLQKEYLIKRATSVISGKFEKINHRVDVNTLEKEEVETLRLNDIASCRLSLTRTIALDKYSDIKGTGSFIVIDKYTNATVGAGMIIGTYRQSSDRHTGRDYSEAERELNAYVRKHFPEWECRDINE